MSVAKIVLAFGILCVMASMGADVWVTRQEAAIHEAMSWVPTSSRPEPTRLEKERLAMLDANLPAYRSTVRAWGIAGWVLVGGSLAVLVAEMMSAHRPRRR